MKTTVKHILFTAVFALMCSASAGAQVAASIETPAKYAILIDTTSGATLLDKEADTRMPTASMSKTMTLYMVFEALRDGHIKLDDTFRVSEKAWRMGGSRMFLNLGSEARVEDLIRGVAIQSGNDASVTLAEGVAGTEEAMVERMNLRAKELGMLNSNFMNASGWPDPNHYSTPRDLAILAERIQEDFPEYYPYFAEREFTYNKIRQPNRDPLLGRVAGADGIKTGHTEEAGYGLIGAAQRDGRRLVMVISGLGSDKARAEEGARLMEWGFRNFEGRTLYKAGETVENAPVWMGREETVPLVPARDVNVTLPIAKRNDLEVKVVYADQIPAPVQKGTRIATLQINVPDQPMVEVALLAGNDVARKGIFGRAWTRVKMMVTGRA